MGWLYFYIVTVVAVLIVSLVLFGINRSEYRRFEVMEPGHTWTKKDIEKRMKQYAERCVFWARFFFMAPIWPLALVASVAVAVKDMSTFMEKDKTEVKTSGTTQYVGTDKRPRRNLSDGGPRA
jgi:hypothetical protein